MSKTIRLDIVTPEKVAFSGEGKMVVVRSINGELGILPRHAPLVAPLQVFPVRFLQEEGETVFACCGGFMEVQNNKVTILTQCAERPEDIDVVRAEAAKQRAEGRLKGEKRDINVLRAEAALRRALMRLKVAKYLKH